MAVKVALSVKSSIPKPCPLVEPPSPVNIHSRSKLEPFARVSPVIVTVLAICVGGLETVVLFASAA